jgi:hypothetical protein
MGGETCYGLSAGLTVLDDLDANVEPLGAIYLRGSGELYVLRHLYAWKETPV